MWTLGENDWITYGWGIEQSDQWHPQKSLCIKYNCPPNSIKRPIEEAIRTVDAIVEKYPRPYTLMCSGGVDSQAMLYAWIKSGHLFNVLSIRYVIAGKVYNHFDLIGLEQFCKIHSVPIEFRDFDIVDFLENKLKSVSTEFDCDSPQLCTYIEMCKFIENGTILFSGNFLGIHNSIDVNYTHLGLHRYAMSMKSSNRAIIPFFFAHDPYLSTSFMPYMKQSQVKEVLYQLGGFPVIGQVDNFTGFEEVKKYYDQFEKMVKTADRVKYSMHPSKRVFDLLFRYPLYIGPGKASLETIDMIS